MITQSDLRRHPRYPSEAPIRVSWRDRRGFQWQDHGHCVDASEGGLKMELPRAVPVDRWISVSLAEPHLDSSALVRHCRLDGSKYLIGVAFPNAPDGVVRATPAPCEPDQFANSQEPPRESRLTLDQPPDDDVRRFFQDVMTRKSKRSVSTEGRRNRWLAVTLIVSFALGVLVILTLPRLLRLAGVAYRHPALQKSSTFVEAVVDYSYRKR